MLLWGRLPVFSVAVPAALLACGLKPGRLRRLRVKNAGQAPAVSAANTLLGWRPGASPGGEAPSGLFARKMKTCPNGAIDDVKTTDTKVAATDGRGGYWYSYYSKSGRR